LIIHVATRAQNRLVRNKYTLPPALRATRRTAVRKHALAHFVNLSRDITDQTKFRGGCCNRIQEVVSSIVFHHSHTYTQGQLGGPGGSPMKAYKYLAMALFVLLVAVMVTRRAPLAAGPQAAPQGRGGAQPAAQPQADSNAIEAERQALQRQLAAVVPTQVVQAGQLAPPPPNAQPSGWDTEESLRGKVRLLATYDSNGPDAWDVAAHPLVYFTSEGVGANPLGGKRASGVQVIDAREKKVIASALFNLGEEVTENPHGVGISPDGKWVYIGEMHRVAATRQVRSVLMVINARTLKLDRLLQGPRADWFHHITAFTDWQGRDRVIAAYGRNAGGGPIFLLDPRDNNRVVKSFTLEDIGYRIGHPYPTVDPTGHFIYIAVHAPPWQGQNHNTAGIAKVNLETGAVRIIPFVGDNPIGMAHTSDGRFTFVNDAHSSNVYKIDNQTNSVVEDTSTGVAGPYGLALNWDESVLYPIGKGEGTHNNGSVVGYVTTEPFRSPRNLFQNMPIWLGGSASSIDHGILHPDPAVNELWISNMNGWETIVLDLNTNKVNAYIPTPNGGDTHSGGFVRYNRDWTGELLADMGGPKRAVRDIMRQRVAAGPAPAAGGGRGGAAAGGGRGGAAVGAGRGGAAASGRGGATGGGAPATAAAAPSGAGGTLQQRGRDIFERTAGGVGCASCHGMDGRGLAALSTPDIRGAGEDRVRPALDGGVPLMRNIRLTDEEIAAVVEHLRILNQQ
jgi:DNA-binding beta-propeller fold protein YncE